MIAAIMQPYFFPYIGYFQLMSVVDVFVFFDDVQYIDRGWVNRNRIRNEGRAAWLTLPVRKACREQHINSREYALSDGLAIKSVEQRLHAAYCKAPFWQEAMPLVSRLLRFGDANVASFNAHLLMDLARRLDIGCRFELSSQIDKPSELKGQAKVIDLCQRIGATNYVNPIGGVELYDPDSFHAAGLDLFFLRSSSPPVKLTTGDPESLSLIDGLMHEGIPGCRARLPEHQLMVAG